MNKIEQAVIELDGEWPAGEAGRCLYVGFSGIDGSGEPFMRWDDGSVEYIDIFKSEFMEARNRLENKPTEWPEGAHILAYCPNSEEWIFGSYFYARPEEGCWIGEGSGAWMRQTGQQGRCFGNWVDSIERRPEFIGMDVASGPDITVTMTIAPHWVPGETLPPVGQEVDIEGDSLVYGNGESGEVVGHFEDTAIVRMSYGLGCFAAEVLFPAKSHKERVIEAAHQVLKGSMLLTPEHAIDRLLEHDMLKLPGDAE